MPAKSLTSAEIIAQELQVKVAQVETTIQLLDEGSTVPFIARYRKEVTEALTDTQIRFISERLVYLRDMDARRQAILQSISEQEKLTPELEALIVAADTKTRLEDLYLPYRPKRHTKAQIAIEAGLEPLALALLADPTLCPETEAKAYIQADKGIADTSAALEGAKQIIMERFTEDAELINQLREYVWQKAVIQSVASNKKDNSKYADYFDYSEALRKIPSHRALALFRGRRESALQVSMKLSDEGHSFCESTLAAHFKIADKKRSADAWLLEAVKMAWKVKLYTKLELELFARLREMADEEAIKVFSGNLRDLLLAAPAGSKVTMGLDPGIRTGVKVAVVDATGKLLDHTVVFPFPPQNAWHQSVVDLAKLAMKYGVDLISIGNGTGSRETERLVAEVIKTYSDLPMHKMVVSEAGASVYSASELAAKEFPELDVTIRGAVSIARRLQDPLAELVKIEPKAIGVGQYQHDVNQSRLALCLDGVVEDCVNAVGVDLNTASPALLRRISGLNETLANNIVSFRDEHGAFANREQLKKVNRMGEKTFQQAAGFLRIPQGDNPLDASSVHPEAYALVEKICSDKSLPVVELIGNKTLLANIQPENYQSLGFGLPTIRDVLSELEKPGRDPRPAFKTAQFKEGVEEIGQLKVGMILEGVVSNVTNFGAFVDIGVHQDGLVHISAMTDKFIKDPRAVAKAGDVVTVKVIEVDVERKRISLSMKLDADTQRPAPKAKPRDMPAKAASAAKRPPIKEPIKKPAVTTKTPFNTTMADALAKLKQRDTL